MQDQRKTKSQLLAELTELRHLVAEFEVSVAARDPSDEVISASEQRYQDLYDNAPDMFVSVDPGTATVVECNKTVLAKLGYSREEIIGRSIFELYHPDCLEAVAKAFQAFKRTGQVSNAALQLQRKDGGRVDVTLNESAVRDEEGNIVRSRSVWHDVTEARQTERELLEIRAELERRVADRTEELMHANEALRHAQKMEAVGQLTGGLAHDFNNLLTVIQTNASLLSDDLPPGADKVRAELRDIQDAARHGANLIDHLLTFSRRSTLTLKTIDVAGLIGRLSETLRRLLPATIDIKTSVGNRPLGIQGDSDAVEQVLMNLANNARDAMPTGGQLRIELETAALDAHTCREQGWGVPGDYVRLLVGDTGVGMDQDAMDKIFEPFFTTKAPGEGTGLGMSIILSLVGQQNGFVDVESEVDQGTTVRVYFPLSAEPTEEAPPPEDEKRPSPGAGETILLVEDEEALRRAGKRVLQRYGYTVLLGVDGEDGLRLFRSHSSEVALVITDVVMPKMGGAELHDAIRREHQGVKFIYTSGYSANDVSSTVPMDPTIPFVSKPWALSALVALVREVLDGAPRA